jgi:hypothetical protein
VTARAPAASLTLDLLDEPLAILRFGASDAVPEWTASARSFLTISRTPTELSIVADAAAVPAGLRPDRRHRAFRVRGPLPLDLIGVFSVIAAPLAAAGIPIFPIATFDTDYLLVEAHDIAKAREALARAGHQVVTA